MKIERSQHIESAIKQMKSAEIKHRQHDFSVVCNDLTRGMGTLMLQVSHSGTATFRYVQKTQGKRTYTIIGKYSKDGKGGITLAQARQEALRYGALAKRGENVKQYIEEQRRHAEAIRKQHALEQDSGSFGQLIESYVQSMKKDGKRTWHRVLASVEKDVFPRIPPSQKARTVTDSQIIQLLAAMINRGAATQSNRIRSYLHAAFNAGLKHDKDPAKQHTKVLFGLKGNPVTHIPKQGSAESVGERCLDRNELTKLLRLLDNRSGISQWSANIIKLCIFTGGQRPYELLTVKPDRIDFENRVLEITEQYSKNKRSHLVPLTQTALELVKWFHDRSSFYKADFLIYKRTNLAEHFRTDSLGTAIDRFCKANDFTHFAPRDIRRTCKTNMGSIQLSKEIRDRIQNHAFADVSSKHYDRWQYLPEKLAALQTWEQWLLGLHE